MSHEIRTPMNAIFGTCAGLKREKDITVNQQMILKQFIKVVNHLLALIIDIFKNLFEKLKLVKWSWDT